MRCTNTKSLCKVSFGVSIHSVISFSLSLSLSTHCSLPSVPTTDQMGVELGKVLAKNILAQLDKPADVSGHDSSVSLFLYLILSLLVDGWLVLLFSRLRDLFITINGTERSKRNLKLNLVFGLLEVLFDAMF